MKTLYKTDEVKNPPRFRILYLQSTSEISGTDITLFRTLELLDRTRFEPHVIIPKEGPLTEAFIRIGCRIHILPDMRKLTRHRNTFQHICFILNYLPAIFKITKVIYREKIDLVHTNTIHNLYGFLAAKMTKKPHVWHIREIVVQSNIMRFIEKYLVQWFSTRFIVMSNAIAELFLGSGDGFPSKIVKLYDGVDIEKFNPKISGIRIRRELGLAELTPVVGMVTRLDPWKGIEFVLEAANLVLKEIPSAKFLLCGGEIEGHTGYQTSLKEKTAKLGIEKSVLFTGWTYCHEDIPEVYASLNVFVHCPLHPEPYGLTNIEAMACGLPIVTVGLGGPAEICVGGETAYFVPPADSRAIAEGILKLLINPEQAKQMGKAGRLRVETFFDRRQCVKKLEAIYDEILAPLK